MGLPGDQPVRDICVGELEVNLSRGDERDILHVIPQIVTGT
jgi:hypothetical protein